MLATFAMTVCGADPTVIIFMLPIALIASEKSKINPMILVVMIMAGSLAGGTGPVSIIGIVTAGLAQKNGVDIYLPIWFASLTLQFSVATLTYFILGGWKALPHDDLHCATPEPFNTKQKIALAIIAFSLILILGFKIRVGGAMAIGAALMLVLRVADEKEAIKSVNWGVLLLVGGTGVLVTVMEKAGGVKMLSAFLSSIMTPETAAPITGMISGFMGFVASWTGVVAPTLFPTLNGISANMNGAVHPISLMQAIQSTGLSVSYSPFSALGAMALASLPASVDHKKIFNHQIIIALVFMAWAMFLNWSGLFKFYVNMFA